MTCPLISALKITCAYKMKLNGKRVSYGNGTISIQAVVWNTGFEQKLKCYWIFVVSELTVALTGYLHKNRGALSPKLCIF